MKTLTAGDCFVGTAFVLMVLTIAASVIVLLSWGVIWAVNTLFALAIPVEPDTIAAMSLLILLFGETRVKFNKKG